MHVELVGGFFPRWFVSENLGRGPDTLTERHCGTSGLWKKRKQKTFFAAWSS
jgi:hypothetical protein